MKALFPSRCASLLSLTLAMMLNSGHSALACAVCYGDTTGSKQGNAATWGIFAMVVIMFGMLGTIIACGFYLNYRAKHPLPDYQDLLASDETQPQPGTAS